MPPTRSYTLASPSPVFADAAPTATTVPSLFKLPTNVRGVIDLLSTFFVVGGKKKLIINIKIDEVSCVNFHFKKNSSTLMEFC